MDSNLLVKFEDRTEIQETDSNPLSTDSNLLVKTEETDSNPSSTDSNLSVKIENRTESKEKDSNPSLNGFESLSAFYNQKPRRTSRIRIPVNWIRTQSWEIRILCVRDSNPSNTDSNPQGKKSNPTFFQRLLFGV